MEVARAMIIAKLDDEYAFAIPSDCLAQLDARLASD
jgi:hypothetical protein